MSSSAALALLLLSLSSPLAICLAHAILTRVIRLLGRLIAPQLVVLGTVLLGNIPVLWLGWILVLRDLRGDFWSMACGIVYLILTYNALGFCYFCLLNLSETSLHVHILMDVLLSGPIPAADLASRYGVGDMLNARVERMIALGQLRSQNELFVVNSRGLLLAGRVIHNWRRLLGLPLSHA